MEFEPMPTVTYCVTYMYLCFMSEPNIRSCMYLYMYMMDDCLSFNLTVKVVYDAELCPLLLLKHL